MPANASTDFQADKPFRLSLYVPPLNLRVNTTPKVNLENSNITTPKRNNNKENEGVRRDKKETKRPRETGLKKSSGTSRKLKELNNILFAEEDIPPVKKKPTTRKSTTKTDKSKKSAKEISEESTNRKENSSFSNKKQEENVNEDEDFEKWAQSINSEFEDIEKFELSVTYDD